MNFNDAAIFSIKPSDYKVHFWYISKNDAINIMNNSKSKGKKGACCNFFIMYKNERM